MDTWRIESSPGKQAFIAWSILIVGLILAFGFRNFDSSGLTNSLAGFLLGLLLLLIGFAGLLMGGKRSVTVDPHARRILIEDVNRFGEKERSISFDEVGKVYVGRLGNREGASPMTLSSDLRWEIPFPFFGRRTSKAPGTDPSWKTGVVVLRNTFRSR